MVFSSVEFLLLFFPVTLFLLAAVPRSGKNAVLTAVSLLFYAWGEGWFVIVMISSILFNYLCGILLDRSIDKKALRRLFLILSVVFNLGLLGFYKYSGFILENLHFLFGDTDAKIAQTHLPIGISFFTFQGLSYIIDVYRREVKATYNPLHVGLYISLFPQLIAGPIVRYTDVLNEIISRKVNMELFASGAKRFVVGLGKKVLIANIVAQFAEAAFTADPNLLTTKMAWIGITCYSLQIYFDFSGYSDMAIGLGRMFGFKFLENFNLPYTAASIQEFWRRWHISLSTWFRDYLYIPLGGNRKGPIRTYVNLITVFFLTGLWHGASWNFILWGLLHGSFLLIERAGFNKLLGKIKIIGHVYTLLVVMVCWVFFRIEDFGHAMQYISAMFGFVGDEAKDLHLIRALNKLVLASLFLGIILSTGLPLQLYRNSEKWVKKWRIGTIYPLYHLRELVVLSFLILVILCSYTELAAGTFNPFIYYRF